MAVPDRDRVDLQHRRRPRSDVPLLVIIVILMLLAVIAGCSSGSTVLDERQAIADNVVFLTLSETPDAFMEALFEGYVVLDEAGCLRLAPSSPDDAATPSPALDGPTVIWPDGFEIRLTIEGLEIWDSTPDGTFSGRVGDRLSLPGGEVASLHEGIPMTARQRTASWPSVAAPAATGWSATSDAPRRPRP